jgi:hypothetical protein
MISKVLLLLASTLAMPALTCGDKPASCDMVECNPNQYCEVLPATMKNCARTVCKDIPANILARPCPRIMLSCDNCAADEECAYTAELGGECPRPVCKKIEPVKQEITLQKRLVCPQYFAPLCNSVECPEGKECVETPETAFSCSKAVCKRKKQELICPEHFAPLCMFHECGRSEECIETTQTATQCSKAKCIAKRA